MQAWPQLSFDPRHALVTGLVFLLSLGLTALAAVFAYRNSLDAARNAFEDRVARTEAAIRNRMLGYEQVLRGGTGLFAAADDVTREDWRSYVANLQIRETYPGVRGVHFALRVKAEQRRRHVSAVRAEGFPEYDIRPPGERDEYYPVVWPEPLDERNRRVVGFDMFSEAVRRAAMQRARDSAMPSVSGKVVLAGETTDPVPGFLMYAAVYRRGARLEGQSDRAEAIIGFVFCPFRMPDLMQGILGSGPAETHVEIYDGPQPAKENWLHNPRHAYRALSPAPRPQFATLRTLQFGGRTWSAYHEPTEAFLATIDRRSPLVALGIGAAASALLAALIAWLLAARATALHASLRDPLTGLFNRRYLEETLAREEARAQRTGATIGVVIFDLDRFKSLNDGYGHDAGDAVLKRVGEALTAGIRRDDIACRYGGEEFTVVLPGASRAYAVARAEQLRAAVAALAPEHKGKVLPRTTISAGVAVFPDDGETLPDALRAADQALLRAKACGRDRIVSAAG